jgi:hypothetical protein
MIWQKPELLNNFTVPDMAYIALICHISGLAIVLICFCGHDEIVSMRSREQDDRAGSCSVLQGFVGLAGLCQLELATDLN